MNKFSNNFKLSFHNDLLNKLYKKSSKFVPEEINKIINKNNILNSFPNNRQSVILFKGIRYRNYKEDAKINNWNKTIPFHLSLHKEMHKLVNYKDDLENEKITISAFIKRILNKCKTIEDIYFLMPELLQNVFPSYIAEQRHESNQLTIRGIHKEEFQKTNEYYLNMLRDRVLTDLLLN